MELWTGRRTLWVRLQFGCGVLNALSMIVAFDQGYTFVAAVATLGVYYTTRWKLPPIEEE